MSKNKNRERNAKVAATTGRITDKPKREPKDMGPIEVQISGPKHFFRYADSVHIVAFKAGSYRNSVPLTTVELKNLRAEITGWLGDEYERLTEVARMDVKSLIEQRDELRARIAYLENEREAKRVAAFEPNTDSITDLDGPDTENCADA